MPNFLTSGSVPARRTGFRRQRPGRRDLSGGAANAPDLLGDRLADGAQLATAAQAVAAGETQQETQLVDLEQVGEIGRVGFP